MNSVVVTNSSELSAMYSQRQDAFTKYTIHVSKGFTK